MCNFPKSVKPSARNVTQIQRRRTKTTNCLRYSTLKKKTHCNYYLRKINLHSRKKTRRFFVHANRFKKIIRLWFAFHHLNNIFTEHIKLEIDKSREFEEAEVGVRKRMRNNRNGKRVLDDINHRETYAVNSN